MDSSTMRMFKIGLLDAVSKYKLAVKKESGVDSAFNHTFDVLAAFKTDDMDEWDAALQFAIDSIDYAPEDTIESALEDKKPTDTVESVGTLSFKKFTSKYLIK